MRNWREKLSRAILVVRWELLPDGAKAADGAIPRRGWEIIRERLNGRSCAEIAAQQGVSKQAIHIAERRALAQLAQLAGRPLVSVDDVRRDEVQPAAEFIATSGRCRKVSRAERIERDMESIADALLEGEISRTEADIRARECEDALLSLDGLR